MYHSIILREVVSLKFTPDHCKCFAAHDLVTVNEQILLTSSLNIAHKLAFSLSLELSHLKCNSLNTIFFFFRVQPKLAVRRL